MECLNKLPGMPGTSREARTFLKLLSLSILYFLLTGCNLNGMVSSVSSGAGSQCQSNCAVGSGARGLNVFVEPDAGPGPLVDAIRGAHKSIKLEIYLLSNHNIIRALEEDANRGIAVRVMLEPHPYGSGPTSANKTLDALRAAGIQAQYSNPAFALTHAKCLLIDDTVAYIMTSNFSNSALGVSKYTKNREYDIIDDNVRDVEAIAAIFQADWERNTAVFDNPDLVVSPNNARHAFITLIGSARRTLLIEAEEMNDSVIEQALIDAAQHGVQVQVILPEPGSSGDANSRGIATITQAGTAVREDPHLYMHAKIIVVDGREAFVGSENISAQSLDQFSESQNHS